MGGPMVPSGTSEFLQKPTLVRVSLLPCCRTAGRRRASATTVVTNDFVVALVTPAAIGACLVLCIEQECVLVVFRGVPGANARYRGASAAHGAGGLA